MSGTGSLRARAARLPGALGLGRPKLLLSGPGAGPNHIGLGTFCHVAAQLRDTGLRRWTGPFDWIFSTPGLIADCLEDDFAAFLALEHLRSVPGAELTNGARRQCHHSLFEDRYGLPTLFNHHDPAASDADRRALRRSVDRFRTAMRAGENALYMMSEVTWPDDGIERLAGLLRRQGTRNHLAVLTVVPDAAERSWRKTQRRLGAETLLDVEIRILSRSTGVRFRDPGDDAYLAQVLREIAAGWPNGGRELA